MQCDYGMLLCNVITQCNYATCLCNAISQQDYAYPYRDCSKLTFLCQTLNPTYLGHLGQYDTNRIITICVTSPKVAKVGITQTVLCHYHWWFCNKKTLVNVQEPLICITIQLYLLLI